MRGLQLLGADPAVRANYRALYRSYPFDGEKLERYGRLWASLALVPSEIDFAFFYDRATHIGGPPDDEALISELGDCIRAETLAGNTHAAARRCLSLRHPHPTLPTDRLGRDVAYYVDAYPNSALSPRELSTWREHIPLSARKSVGLSDARNYPLEHAFNAADPSGETPEANDELTPAEAACPLSSATTLAISAAAASFPAIPSSARGSMGRLGSVPNLEPRGERRGASRGRWPSRGARARG